MGLVNYNNITKDHCLLRTVTMLALNFFFSFYLFLKMFGQGLLEMGREVAKLQVKALILEEPLFLCCLQTLHQSEHTEMALSFQFIYLPALYIDIHIKMNLPRDSMYATSIYSSCGSFLFCLKNNLSFLFNIPPSLSHSLSLSKQVFRKPCCPALFQRLLKAKRWR